MKRFDATLLNRLFTVSMFSTENPVWMLLLITAQICYNFCIVEKITKLTFIVIGNLKNLVNLTEIRTGILGFRITLVLGLHVQ